MASDGQPRSGINQFLADACDTIERQVRYLLYQTANTAYSPEYTKSLKAMLDTGASPKRADYPIPEPFNAVVENGDLDAVELMIDHGVDPASFVDQCLLHKAAANPRVEVLEFLLCTGHFDPDQPDDSNRTALFYAAHANNPEAVELLLNWGARANFVDSDGFSPLHDVKYEEGENTTKCIELLLRHGADGTAIGQKGRSAFYWAAWYGSEMYSPEYGKRLKLFLEHGAAKKLDRSAYQVFGCVVEFGDVPDVKLFFDYGIELSKCRENNCAVVHHAAINRRIEVMEFVLSTGIFDPSSADETSFTALHVAVQMFNPRAVIALLDAGAKVDPVNRRGFTPFLCALDHARWGQSAYDAVIAKSIEVLLARGADVNLAIYGNGRLGLFPGHVFDFYARDYDLSKMPKSSMQIIGHANLLQSQGRHVHPGLFRQKVKNEACQAELKALQVEVLGGSTSLYDVLAEEKVQLQPYKSESMQKLEDPEYVRKLQDRFPIYGDRLVGAIEYLNLRESAAEKLSHLFGLPRESIHFFIERLVSVLTRRDLRALSRL